MPEVSVADSVVVSPSRGAVALRRQAADGHVGDVDRMGIRDNAVGVACRDGDHLGTGCIQVKATVSLKPPVWVIVACPVACQV